MSGQHCESYDVKRETDHCYPVNSSLLTAVARDGWNLSAVFKFCCCFVLLYNKSLNDWSLGEKWILFPSNLNVSLDFVSGNIEILGKQNSLFPSGPVIKCLLLYLPTQIRFPIGGECVTCRESKLTKNINFGLARDQVVLLETAANLWASRSRANDFFALFSSFELFMTGAAGNSEFYFPSTSK